MLSVELTINAWFMFYKTLTVNDVIMLNLDVESDKVAEAPSSAVAHKSSFFPSLLNHFLVTKQF